MGQLQQRDLPGPPALGVGVEVEFVHDDRTEFGGGPFAEGNVREDLCRAADDRRVLVHAGITGDHANVFCTEDVAQGKELLRDQSLDGRCVVAALAPRHGLEVRRDGHQRLSGARWGCKDDVGTGGELHDGLVLGGVQVQPPAFGPLKELRVQGVRVDACAGWV